MMRLSLIHLAILALAGCQAVTVAPPLAPLDLTLTRRCDDPVSIPPRDLSERDVVSLWGSDRLALKDCGRRHAATVTIIEERDARLSRQTERAE